MPRLCERLAQHNNQFKSFPASTGQDSCRRAARIVDIDHKYSEEQITGFLRQVEAGMPVKEIGLKHGFSDASFYKWRSKYGGMDASEAKRLRELELENDKLKRLLAEAHLDIHALKSVFGTKR